MSSTLYNYFQHSKVLPNVSYGLHLAFTRVVFLCACVVVFLDDDRGCFGRRRRPCVVSRFSFRDNNLADFGRLRRLRRVTMSSISDDYVVAPGRLHRPSCVTMSSIPHDRATATCAPALPDDAPRCSRRCSAMRRDAPRLYRSMLPDMSGLRAILM